MTAADLNALSPVLILALGSAVLLLTGAWWPRGPLLWLGTATALAAAAAAAFHTSPVAEIAGLYGAGPYARFFTVLWALTAAITLLFSMHYGGEREFSGGEYTALVLFGAAGMSLLSSAVSLVGFFLGLEAFTLVLYILIAFDRNAPQGAEAGVKYLVLGAVATGFLSFGIALIYTASGTFHLPEAMTALAEGSRMRPLGLLGWGMLLVAVGFKVSLVPFHLWTPDVYQGAPAPVTGLLSTGSKGAVFAALVTVVAAVRGVGESLAPLLAVMAAATMLVGTFCALRQNNLKRLLAYSSVVHMGYVLVALLTGTPAGSAAVVFYLVAYAAVNLGAFGVIASFSWPDTEPQRIDDLRGLGYRHPLRCGALAVFLFSLAGVPPTAGFIGKFGIFLAAVESGYVLLALLGVLASLVSLYYYLRVIVAMFMSHESAPSLALGTPVERTALAVCLAVTLGLGIVPGPLLDLIAGIVP